MAHINLDNTSFNTNAQQQIIITNITLEFAADALSRRYTNIVLKVTFQSMLSQSINNSLNKAANLHINFIYTFKSGFVKRIF